MELCEFKRLNTLSSSTLITVSTGSTLNTRLLRTVIKTAEDGQITSWTQHMGLDNTFKPIIEDILGLLLLLIDLY